MRREELILLGQLLFEDYKKRIAVRNKIYREVAKSIQAKIMRGELPKSYKMDKLTPQEKMGSVQDWIIRVRKAQLRIVIANLRGEPYIPDEVTGKFPRYNGKAGL